MRVVGGATTAADLWPRLREAGPDLLLVEWELLGPESGVGLARLRALDARMCIVVLGGHPARRPRAIAAGADAFVSKADSAEQLIKTLRAVCACGDADNRTVETEGGEG